GSPDRYRGATCSSHARLYKAPTVSSTFGSRITRNCQRCIFPPLGAHTPASRIFRISSFGTGSGFSRHIDRVVRMISNVQGRFAAIGSWTAPASRWKQSPRPFRSAFRRACTPRSPIATTVDPREFVLPFWVGPPREIDFRLHEHH